MPRVVKGNGVVGRLGQKVNGPVQRRAIADEKIHTRVALFLRGVRGWGGTLWLSVRMHTSVFRSFPITALPRSPVPPRQALRSLPFELPPLPAKTVWGRLNGRPI